jgi:thiosulfate/3-mercaptopyruvate sulfurtransferase
MSASPLISADDAAPALRVPNTLAVDCRFDLADTARGEREFLAGHLPGAVYAHLDRDLADLAVRGRGRHPLPAAGAFSRTLSRWGITRATRVIAYDDGREARAARLWWMLRIVGHPWVRVLDGGITAWRAAGLPLKPGAETARTPSNYQVQYDADTIVGTATVQSALAVGSVRLIDARAAARFRGESEPIDPVAGHVPGARNRPFNDNLDEHGRFRPAADLRAEFERLLGAHRPEQVVHMCGSGVTACSNLLAMEYAGLGGARVYAGSWSEWIDDPSRPVARGAE